MFVLTSVVHLDVEDFSEELLRCLLCHKEPARRIQSPLLGAFCLLLAGSLWHKGAYNRTFQCMEANYPYLMPLRTSSSHPKPPVGGFGCDELVLCGIRDTGVATLWTISTNESRASLSLDQWEWSTLVCSNYLQCCHVYGYDHHSQWECLAAAPTFSSYNHRSPPRPHSSRKSGCGLMFL